MSDTGRQPNLISDAAIPGIKQRVTLNTPLQAAIGLFEQHMRDEGFSIHTVKAFASDLRLLGQYVGIGQPVGDIGTKDLNDFLGWLTNERGVPCSPKSYSRRVTTLKVFFGWLLKTDTLLIDPSNAVIQRSVTSPLPKVPSLDDIENALAVTQAWATEGNKGKVDPRPHLLLTLLLKTGIKKGEAMAIVPNHIVRDDAEEPYLFIRYKNPRMRYKERKVELDPIWLETLDNYLAQYAPTDTLFTCTARNLEYVLRDVGEAGELDKGLLSFENLRWRSALTDYVLEVDQDTIRQRLGLSKVTWRDTKNKLGRLTENADKADA
ncbi:MAG: tyrosine-type recombinase/integrase [Candidatus Promineifilaceae bacterium]